MNAPQALHPTDQTLHAYGLGKLDDASAESVNSHLEGCPACRRRVAELSSDSFLGRLRDAKVQPGSSRPAVSSTDGLSMLEGAAAVPAPPPASTLPPGLADHPDYEILRELGQGGMGTVFLARNTLMGRMEVLKVVSGHLLNRRGVFDRFRGEIRNAARLHHPNIVAAYSALRLGESLVLAMEYVEGLDLSRMVKARGPLPVANACNYAHQAALGLQHAHERGMVHRDIKPSNLMLARQGNRAVVQVLDFGLAKVQSEGAVDGGLTHEGQMLGTPDYIAPEQISNARHADIRADIYSLGCTLYYLLTGKPPFQGTSLYDILQAHHSMEAAPLNLVRPEVPTEVAAIVAKMMAKEPERRFQEPKEVAQALKPFFKAGNVASVGSKPDLSGVTPPEPKREAADAGPVPKRTATGPEPVAASPGRKPGQTPRSEPMWESLIDLKETESSPVQAPAVALNRRPPWLWPAAAVGVLLLALIAVWGTGVIKIKTPEGYIVLKDLPDQATVLVDGKKATVQQPDGGEPAEITVVPGEHVVEVKKDGFTMRGQKVTVETGGKTTLIVELEPLETPPPKTGDDGPARSGVAKPPAPAATGAVKTTSPAPPPISAADPDTNPTVAMDNKDGKANVIINTIGMTLKLIPAGEFMMGSPEDDDGAGPAEKPQHKVRISPFYLGIYEVTQAQYEAVMGNNPSYFSPNAGGKDKVAGQSTDRFPVENISWFDAVRFCNDLSRKEGRTPFYGVNGKNVEIPDRSGPGYRLPTEAEWEYACRANTSTPSRFSFGDDFAELGEYGWFKGNSENRTHPVGEKKPNGFGLHDMHGNVWEWCWDWYGAGYDKHTREYHPDGYGREWALLRVGRGGAWVTEPRLCRSAYRQALTSDYGRYERGFRVALVQSGRLPRNDGADPTQTAKKDARPDAVPALKIPSSQELIKNSIGMTLRLIPAGEFMMGSPGDDEGAGHEEKPPHKVRISPFYLGIYEVTQEQYKAVMGNNPSSFKGSDDLPVEKVSWLDAVKFCNELSEKESLKSFYELEAGTARVPDLAGSGYRLPTEAEWEYACRAGSATAFSFGDDIQARLGDFAWFRGNSEGKTHRVGQKRPNAFGLYDMHGNVWEWCSDWYGGAYYRQSPVDDPPGAGQATHRVMRGGSWFLDPQYARAASRGRRTPEKRIGELGFRVARVQSAR